MSWPITTCETFPDSLGPIRARRRRHQPRERAADLRRRNRLVESPRRPDPRTSYALMTRVNSRSGPRHRAPWTAKPEDRGGAQPNRREAAAGEPPAWTAEGQARTVTRVGQHAQVAAAATVRLGPAGRPVPSTRRRAPRSTDRKSRAATPLIGGTPSRPSTHCVGQRHQIVLVAVRGQRARVAHQLPPARRGDPAGVL